jgi:hypothetical protein
MIRIETMRQVKKTGPSDDAVSALLERRKCPVAFHEVRTRFLGNIASPLMTVSPLDAVKGLWGGELPELESIDAVNELVGALVMGLWNRLTDHQDRRTAFRLIRFEVPADRDGVARIALVRRQEIDGFVEGLFGDEEEIELPERAHQALGVLSEVRAFFAGIVDLMADRTKPATPQDLAQVLRTIQQLTIAGETEIHKAVLSCTRARRQALSTSVATKPRADC